MRRPALASLLMVLAAAPASGQALSNEFAYGRDYTFERVEATRAVNDAEDTGTIRLVTYVYRPVKNDRREVVLFSHGSTGGLGRSPKEPLELPFRPAIRYFVSRGYTCVVPMRRGRGESTGTYVEECSACTGQCTTADQVALTERGLRESLLLGVTSNLSGTENQQRVDAQTVRLARAAKSVRVPTIWIYAVRDPLYRDDFPPEMLRAWREPGGQAEFVHITEHSLPNAHLVPSEAGLWARQMDAFMKRIEGPPK